MAEVESLRCFTLARILKVIQQPIREKQSVAAVGAEGLSSVESSGSGILTMFNPQQLICGQCKKKICMVWNNGTSHIMAVVCQACFEAKQEERS